MSKFLADFGQGEERAAKAEAGFRSYYQELLDNRPAGQQQNFNAGYVNAASPLASKIAQVLQQHGGHADGNTSLTETANVLASSVAKQGSFSAKVSHIEMMIGPHLKKEGEFRANPDLLKAVVGDVLKVTDPPPAKPKGLGM